jgi:hypothetical protein
LPPALVIRPLLAVVFRTCYCAPIGLHRLVFCFAFCSFFFASVISSSSGSSSVGSSTLSFFLYVSIQGIDSRIIPLAFFLIGRFPTNWNCCLSCSFQQLLFSAPRVHFVLADEWLLSLLSTGSNLPNLEDRGTPSILSCTLFSTAVQASPALVTAADIGRHNQLFLMFPIQRVLFEIERHEPKTSTMG